MFAFKTTNTNIYSKSITATSPDALYWKALGVFDLNVYLIKRKLI